MLVWCGIAVAVLWTDGHTSARAATESFGLFVSATGSFTLRGFASHWARVVCEAAWGVLLVAVLWGSGRAARAWFRSVGGSWLSSWTEAMLVGLLGAGILGLAAGLAGVLYHGTLLAMFALPAFIAWTRGKFGRPRMRRPKWSWTERMCLIFGTAAAVPLVMAALAPVITNDPLAHGLGAPAHYLRMHRIIPSERYHFDLPNLMELATCMFWDRAPLAVYTGLSLVLLLLTGFAWSRATWGRAAALLGLVSVLTSTQVAFLVAQFKDDLLAAAFALAAYVVWERHAPRGHRGGEMLAGALLGGAFAVKYPAAAIGGGILVWQLMELVRGGGRTSAKGLLAFWGGCAACAAPFLAKGWLHTGNPVFPYFFGGLGWSARHAALLIDQAACPGRDIEIRDPGAFFLGVIRLLREQSILAWVMLPALFLGAKGSSRSAARAVPVAVLGIGWAALLAPCLRFMVAPAIVLGHVGAARWVELLAEARGRRGHIGRAMLVAALSLGVLRIPRAADRDSLYCVGRFAVGLGLEPETGFADHRLTTLGRAAARVAVNPPRKLLLIGEVRAWPFARSTITISQDTIDLPIALKIVRAARDAHHVAIKFRQLGTSDVVLNYVGSEWKGAVMAAVFVWTPAELRRYADFAARWLEPLPPFETYDYANGGFLFYRVRGSPKPPSFRMPFLPGLEGLAEHLAGETRDQRRARLEALVKLLPEVCHFESTLGCVLVESGRYGEAVQRLRRGLTCGFEDAGSYGCLGLALEQLGRKKEAAEAFCRAAALRPGEAVFERKCAECGPEQDNGR